jgi:peptidylamidoglycolate lyase
MPGLRGVYSTVVPLFFVLLSSSLALGAPKPASKAAPPPAAAAPPAPAAVKPRPDWLPPNPNDFVVSADEAAPVQYYEEPGQRPVEEDLEALANGNYPYPAFVGLNENGLEELPTIVGEEAMIPQDFSDMPSLVEEGGDEDSNSFFELPSSIGQTAGLAVDAQQNLILFHRSGREWDEWSFDANNRLNRSLGPIPNATIAVLDTRTGKVLGEHGSGMFYMPHGLSLDPTGNVWLTDVGSHQVMKLDGRTFKPLLVLGEKLVPGSDDKHFCKPTDVAVAKSGEFFVADGYCNSRVMKFDKEGNLITTFGEPNSADPPKIGEFFVPHSLVLIEDLNLLCVADRENERIQCFAAGLNEAGGPSTSQAHHPRAYIPTGTFFTKAERIGRVFAIREKQHYLVGVTSTSRSDADGAAPTPSGGVDPQIFVMDMNTGRANTFAKGLENAHALALSDAGDIYVAQMRPNQIVKFSVPSAQGGPTVTTEA